jgi:pimeloyl-ACP methyl ester carboxylesterase
VPALAIWTPPSGFQDTDAESRAFAQLNPHLATRTIDDCGALPHEERPADFEAVVREWWEGLGEHAVMQAPGDAPLVTT